MFLFISYTFVFKNSVHFYFLFFLLFLLSLLWLFMLYLTNFALRLAQSTLDGHFPSQQTISTLISCTCVPFNWVRFQRSWLLCVRVFVYFNCVCMRLAADFGIEKSLLSLNRLFLHECAHLKGLLPRLLTINFSDFACTIWDWTNIFSTSSRVYSLFDCEFEK